MKNTHIRKKLGQLHNIYCNNFGVDYFLLKDGKILMQAHKLGRLIKYHSSIISKEDFETRFKDESRSEYENVLDALEFLEPGLI